MKVLQPHGWAALLLLCALSLGPTGAMALQDPAPAAALARGAYFGVRGEPGTQKGSRGLTVTEVAPGSPAEEAGMQAGDLLIFLVRTDGPRDAFLKRPQVHADEQGRLEAWLETQEPGREVQAWWSRAGRVTRKNVRLALPVGAATTVASYGARAEGIETARTAYLQMCGKGAEKLGPATCFGMKRDLDAALAAQASAARETEVMAVHRRLCAPAARKLSEDTCAAMLEEGRQALAAEVAQRPSAAVTPRDGGRREPASVELKSAHDELCTPGALQVSAETCAALKVDATPRRRSR